MIQKIKNAAKGIKEFCIRKYALPMATASLLAGSIYANNMGKDDVSRAVHVGLEIPYVYAVVELMHKYAKAHPLIGIGTALAVKNFADYLLNGDNRKLIIATGATLGSMVSAAGFGLYNKLSGKEDLKHARDSNLERITDEK
ncbi:hypothetical protein HYW76_01310 [Candidatus Pacearchaeota archaeon]|nr:hypothetical protein [Candidatus Pacearchaeota archaeon]